MSLASRALAAMDDTKSTALMGRLHGASNARKRRVYWIGFLAGILASGRIEKGELDAVAEELSALHTRYPAEGAFRNTDLTNLSLFDESSIVEILQDEIISGKASLVEEVPWSEKDILNEFLGFCSGVISDGKILALEAQVMMSRFYRTEALMTAPFFSNLRAGLFSVMSDGTLTEEESEDLREWIAVLVGDGHADTGVPNVGISAKPDDPITEPSLIKIDRSVFVLTGAMRMGPRSHITKEIERRGGTVDASVTGRTDYVVVSSNASAHWKTTHFGTKMEKAKGMIDKGHPVRFVAEFALERALGLPPSEEE